MRIIGYTLLSEEEILNEAPQKKIINRAASNLFAAKTASKKADDILSQYVNIKDKKSDYLNLINDFKNILLILKEGNTKIVVDDIYKIEKIGNKIKIYYNKETVGTIPTTGKETLELSNGNKYTFNPEKIKPNALYSEDYVNINSASSSVISKLKNITLIFKDK